MSGATYLVVAESDRASWLCGVAADVNAAADLASTIREESDENRAACDATSEAVQASRVWVLAWGWRADCVAVQAGWNKDGPDLPWVPCPPSARPVWPVTPDTRGAWSGGWA